MGLNKRFDDPRARRANRRATGPQRDEAKKSRKNRRLSVVTSPQNETRPAVSLSAGSTHLRLVDAGHPAPAGGEHPFGGCSSPDPRLPNPPTPEQPPGKKRSPAERRRIRERLQAFRRQLELAWSE